MKPKIRIGTQSACAMSSRAYTNSERNANGASGISQPHGGRYIAVLRK